jgi:hypothetical protein
MFPALDEIDQRRVSRIDARLAALAAAKAAAAAGERKNPSSTFEKKIIFCP